MDTSLQWFGNENHLRDLRIFKTNNKITAIGTIDSLLLTFINNGINRLPVSDDLQRIQFIVHKPAKHILPTNLIVFNAIYFRKMNAFLSMKMLSS